MPADKGDIIADARKTRPAVVVVATSGAAGFNCLVVLEVREIDDTSLNELGPEFLRTPGLSHWRG